MEYWSVGRQKVLGFRFQVSGGTQWQLRITWTWKDKKWSNGVLELGVVECWSNGELSWSNGLMRKNNLKDWIPRRINWKMGF